MKKEVRILENKAINALILSIELFNRPQDQGRIESVLILLDHSFEMLLKAAILHRGGKIRNNSEKQTIGFDECIRKSLSNGNIKFLSEERALCLQTLNSLRDAAQHHIIDISEEHFYLQIQTGVIIFKEIAKTVFNIELYNVLPSRVLPVAVKPPQDLITLFNNEIKEIRKLLQPRSRHKIEALNKLRALAIVDSAIQGEKLQPGQSELNKLAQSIKNGLASENIFPGVSSINITTDGSGHSIELKISKTTGEPIKIDNEGTPGASVVAIKRVNELGYYTLGRNALAKKLNLSGNQTTAIIKNLHLQEDPDYYKEFRMGKSSVFKRYSQKALQKIAEFLKSKSADEIREIYQNDKHSK